jgi:hypothetical protein
MRAVFALLAALCVLLAGDLASAQISWRPVNSPLGRFTAQFPGVPMVQAPNTVQTALGPLDIQSYDVDLHAAGYFAVTYTDYPAAAISMSNPDSVLEGAKNGAVTNVHGTLLDAKTIAVQGYPGRDLKIFANNQTVFQRIVLARNRLYQLIVVMPGTRPTAPPEVLRFDQGFVITH